MTPQELENQREQERRDRKKLQRKLALQKVATSAIITAATQTTALDKLNQSINSKVSAVRDKAITQLTNLATDLGIEGLETGNPQLPNLCPSQPILDKATTVRNALLVDLENTARYANITNQSLTIVNSLLKGSIDAVTAINLIKTASAVGVKAAPTVPGFVTSLLADLDDIRTILTFDKEGNPKLAKLKRVVENGTTYVSTAASILNVLLGLLLVIDKVLEKCGSKPTPVGNDIKNLTSVITTAENSNTDTIYKGFTFEIVEKYFSPTLNQKIGQAKNKQGIVLLQTEPSFTQDPKVLIEELKLIIDRDNLKAD
jgi:hypothetical protein